jgi:hypothetical protein
MSGRLGGVGLGLALVVVTGLGLGCRSVPASLDLGSGEAAPAKIVVEPPAKPRAGSTSSLAAFQYASEEILGLYRCWFRRPYEYMFRFEGEPLQVQGREYGVFTAGVRGILYYGDLNNCAGELTGTEARSYSDIRPIEALAGVPATLADRQLGFAVVNPEFIHYARRTLIPHPEQSVDGISVQVAYQRVFRRFFRVMALSLMTVLEHDELELEAKAYLLDVHRGMDGIDYLEGRFGGAIADPFSYRDGTAMTPAMAAGFWLRRYVDGSYADCWHALRDVLVRFDGAWLAEQRAQLPRAAQRLDALPDPMGAAQAGQGAP